MKFQVFLTSFLLLSYVATTTAVAQDVPQWDAQVFDFTVKKPEKGRRWIIDTTDLFSPQEDPYSPADLIPGDEIMELNDKPMTVNDDLEKLLREAVGAVKIRTKRGSGRRPTFQEKSVQKITNWDRLARRFKRKKEAASGAIIWTHAYDIREKYLSGFSPALITKEGSPIKVKMQFQYAEEKSLLISQVDFRYGEQLWTLKKSPLRDIVRIKRDDGEIRETFSDVDGWALEALSLVAANPNAESVISLTGAIATEEIEFPEYMRKMFADTWLMRELWLQRFGK